MALMGDIGKTGSGKNKKIIWTPEKDSVFLDEEVLVEVKAEKYTRSFNKGSMMLLSTVMPGLGQTKIKGKPYWLAGVAAYGALAGGFVVNQSYVKTYDEYLNEEEDGVKRRDLLEKAQSQSNLSGIYYLYSGRKQRKGIGSN